MKRFLSCMLALVLLLSLVPALSSASAAEYNTYTYYPRCSQSQRSIVDGLKQVGADSSYANRKQIAALNGISSYSGTASQNIRLLNLLKQGKLIKSNWAIQFPSSKTLRLGQTNTVEIKFKGSGISSCSYSVKKSFLSARWSVNWKPAGQWCTATIWLTPKARGNTALDFSISGTRYIGITMPIYIR
ncbi:MAG: DUF3597 family protein [bacterium]